MTPGARAAAAIEVLDRVLAGEPAEKALTNWGRANRYAGSSDRQALRDLVFDALRRKRSAAARGGAMTGRGLMLGLLREDGQEALFDGKAYAPPRPVVQEKGRAPSAMESLDVPDWLLPDLHESLGDSCSPVLMALRQRAPVFLRVNLRKTDLLGAIAALEQEGMSARPNSLASTALELTDNARRLQSSQAYREGLVELQDASSQAVVEALPLVRGMRVLDYCAGGGGKTLAMAGRADVALFAHDAAPARMSDLPMRSARAGVTVMQLVRPETKAPYNLVLVDAPCSGSGSWRRDPEGKWRLTSERLQAVVQTQAEILEKAAPLVGPGGCLAYATCSLLKVENGDQVRRFLARHAEWWMERELSMTPLSGGDGFYLALLRRK
jgi:16S rRNA (cytosine967-C5)-methyltransferase